jgi:hypothetical protein
VLVFSKPEGAVAAFLDAENRNDIDGLAAAQDLRFEAREKRVSSWG